MDFSGRIFLAALEEDNEQRSLYRVRLLVDENGLVDPEELETLGDEGYLRIVPDRQEQYTFKERLRLLGPVCLVDLKHIGPDLMKVRQNKNYAPARGEHHQFVLYSDTVHPLHSQPVYEVVSNPNTAEPLTRGYYLRKGGNIQGPYDRETGELLDGLSCIAPDSDKLFAVELPDGREHMFFWPRVVAGQAPLQRRPENTVPPPAYEEIGWTPGAHAIAPVPCEEESAENMEAPAAEATVAPLPAAPAERPTTAQADPGAAADAIRAALQQAGFVCNRDDAMHLLLCLALFPRVEIRADYACDALLAARITADALGAQWVSTEADSCRRQGGFCFTMSAAGPRPPRLSEPNEDVTVLVVGDGLEAVQETLHRPAPVIRLEAAPGMALSMPDQPAVPIRVDLLRQTFADRAADLSDDADNRLREVEQEHRDAGRPLPLFLRHDLLRYLRRAHSVLEGGAAAALRYAETCLVLPFVNGRGPQTPAGHDGT